MLHKLYIRMYIQRSRGIQRMNTIVLCLEIKLDKLRFG